jgi:twitching motility protein PilT
MITIEQLLRQAVQMGAKDVYICDGMKPKVLINSAAGQIIRKMNYPDFSVEDVTKLIPVMMTAEKSEVYRKKRQVDFLFELPNIGRFRVHAYSRNGNPACVVRVISDIPENLGELNLPCELWDICKQESGLVVIAGSAGSGKSMTAAALMQEILRTQPAHVVTLERPAEYILHDEEGVVSRLEVGSDVLSYTEGVEALAHLGADVLMIGELENADAVLAAVLAASKGCRVYTTINSLSASYAMTQMTAMLGSDKGMGVLFSQLKKTIITQSLVYKDDILCPEIKYTLNT